MLVISIPEPCHENWDKMSLNEQGAFCNVCSKTVIDFTTLNDEEVKNYFLKNHGHQTCGRFRNKQLTDAENPLTKILVSSIPFWKKILAIVIILFGSFLTGCEQPVQGKVAIPDNKSKQVDNLQTTLGVTLTEFDEKIQMGESQIEECTTTVGFIEPVIIPDTVCPDSPAIVEIFPDSSSTVIKTELQRIDSVRKVNSEKADCDSMKTKNIIFLNP